MNINSLKTTSPWQWRDDMTPSGLASPRMAKLTSMYNFHHGVSFLSVFLVIYNLKGGSVAEWLACYSGAEGPGFKSQLRRYRVTVLG